MLPITVSEIFYWSLEGRFIWHINGLLLMERTSIEYLKRFRKWEIKTKPLSNRSNVWMPQSNFHISTNFWNDFKLLRSCWVIHNKDNTTRYSLEQTLYYPVCTLIQTISFLQLGSIFVWGCKVCSTSQSKRLQYSQKHFPVHSYFLPHAMEYIWAQLTSTCVCVRSWFVAM